jgi:hypothetical protein
VTNRGYKRSWKNLLINKRYQLSFTLLMVGLATLLIVGLGIFVMYVANETTRVSKTSAQGTWCEPIPEIEAPHEERPDPPPPSMQLPEDDPAPETGSGSADDPPPRNKINVTLEPMQLPPPVLIVPPVPDDFGERVIRYWACELSITNELNDLEEGRLLILYVLIGTGLLLVFGLAAYGIKMTHKVAGPLFKVQLYLAKMRDGRFDKVYNLRKGDQLVSFYEHFKAAHAGVVRIEKGDIERLRAVIEAAEAAGAGENAAVVQLRELVARKEKALE